MRGRERFSYCTTGNPKIAVPDWFDEQFETVIYDWKVLAALVVMIASGHNARVFPNCNECSVAETAPGRLLLMMRNGLGRLFQAWSNENVESWSRPQPTSLAASTGPPQVRILPNGHLPCVWSQGSEEEIKREYARTRPSSAISRNGGSVWELSQNVHSLHETTRV